MCLDIVLFLSYSHEDAKRESIKSTISENGKSAKNILSIIDIDASVEFVANNANNGHDKALERSNSADNAAKSDDDSKCALHCSRYCIILILYAIDISKIDVDLLIVETVREYAIRMDSCFRPKSIN